MFLMFFSQSSVDLSSALETCISSTLRFLCQADEEIILPLTPLITNLFLVTLCMCVRPSQKVPKRKRKAASS